MNPSVPDGTRIAEISPSPVLAVTVTKEVISVPEFVMNALAPLTVHMPTARTARVLVAPASEPASGSVRPKPASVRPATRSGSQSCFCCSVPKVRIGLIPRPTPASRVIPIDWSTRPSSSIAMHSAVKSAPDPPYSSGTTSPNKPSSPIAWTAATGKRCSRSHRATCGATSRSAKSRTTFRNISWSSDSSNIVLRSPSSLIDVDVYVNHTRRMVPAAEERVWSVGGLAAELGITTRTLRFYETEGLITPERRGSYRIYRPRDHARMRLILRGKRFGMSLAEIREIVDMYDGAASSERRQ